MQARVDAASPGDTVKANSCIYRETVVIDKPITLEGKPGSEIRGSDVWTDWKENGSHWVKGVVPDFPVQGECRPGTSRCLWPEQVFLDGEPLTQVASDPESGQFAVDDDRRVVLADDPAGHTVEVTTRRQWVVSRSYGVTVEGFTMKHAANEPGLGAITNYHYGGTSYDPGWTIQDNVLSDAHAVVVILRGENNELLHNDISRGGQLGAGVGGRGNSIQSNKIHHNNTENFDQAWEAGGLKAAGNVDDLTFDGNKVYSNGGPGLWCDADCTDTIYSYNRVHDNAGPGILFEISDGAKIYGNVVWENGWHYTLGLRGAGIVSSSSSNVEIYDNAVAWNATGIQVISADRDGARWDIVKNIYVHDNIILSENTLSLDWVQWWDGLMYQPASNNRGAENEYWYPFREDFQARFSWNGEEYSRLSDFNATPGEENGRYLTSAEKERAVSEFGLPTLHKKPLPTR